MHPSDDFNIESPEELKDLEPSPDEADEVTGGAGAKPGEARDRPGEQRWQPGEQRYRPGEQRYQPGS